MKILLVHNFYQQAGGEDTVVSAEQALLSRYGHEVQLWSVSNHDLPAGFLGKIQTAVTTSYSPASKAIALKKLSEFLPDVVHVHNFFPQISPSVYDACAELNIPVVQTLHNYRLICPGALLMRDGVICEQCVSGSPYQAALYGCYRGSKLGSLVVAHMVAQHRRQHTWSDKVNRFIALTQFAKSKFVEAGFPEHKISVKANFVPEPKNVVDEQPRQSEPFALFVGRLSQEKGIKTLAAAWQKLPNSILLKVAGNGELAHLVQNQVSIEYLGFQSPASIDHLMKQAAFLVMPSECYEGFPMVLVEALAHGLPVIAANLGSMAEIIADGKNGLLFEPGNSQSLADQAKDLMTNTELRQRLGIAARKEYFTNYTPNANYHLLLEIYQQVVAESNK